MHNFPIVLQTSESCPTLRNCPHLEAFEGQGKQSYSRHTKYYLYHPMTSNAYGFYVPQVQPRRLEELHVERSYLLSSLQQENTKATELLRKLPSLEETLVRSQIPHEKRRARKQIGWLSYRIGETTRQEKTILNRLCQLAQEIQLREKRNQIEIEQHYCGLTYISPVVPFYGMQQVYFKPTTSYYQPQEFPFPYVPTPKVTHLEPQCETRGFSWPNPLQNQVARMPAEIWSLLSPERYQYPPQRCFYSEKQTKAFATTAFEKPPRLRRSSSMSDVMGVELLATHTPPVEPSRMERHNSTGGKGSVKIWSGDEGGDTEAETSGSYQYSGYYINR